MPHAPAATLAQHVGALARAGDAARGLTEVLDILGRDLEAACLVLDYVKPQVKPLTWAAHRREGPASSTFVAPVKSGERPLGESEHAGRS